jgi:hypothetical protein
MGGDAVAAAYRVAKGMQGQYAFDLSKVTHDQAIEDMVKFADNFRTADAAAQKAGIGNIAIGRLDARDKGAIAEAVVSNGSDTGSKLDAWESWKQLNPNSAAANNANFDTQIKQLIEQHGDDPVALNKSIMDIKARTQVEGFPEDVSKQLAKEGYVPIKPRNLEAPFKEGSGKLVTKYAGNNDFFTKAVQPLPVLGSVGTWLTGMGLSPNASTNTVYEMFNDNLARNLQKTGAFTKLAIHGDSSMQTTDTIIKQLSEFAHGMKLPVKDLRQLTYRQIGKALDIGASDAKEIQNAITDAHLQVPLAFRGLGDSAVDWSYKLPGSAPVMRQYMKIQGALRFAFNPFFQYLRVIPKTEILTQAEGGGYLNSVFAGRAGQIEGIRSDLRSGGFLNEAGHLGNVISGEAEGGVGYVGKNINKKLLPMQERSIAGLVDAQAQRMGMSTTDYIQQHPEQVRDTVQGIAEYDRKGNFINSPMARTLNIAFFPFRFDAKVATIFARNLSKSSLLTQVSVINGVMKGHDFLNSPEGKAWYAQNSTAIGLINYITPLASMADVFESLMPGHDHSLGNFGELGGLPFGWIPQLLDAEGLTHFNQPAMDAKTGKMFPTYIPATAKGQLATAVQDLIGQLFSYPGAEIGLPSKSSITRNAALGITGATKATDLQLTTPQPNAQQAADAQSLGGIANTPQPTNTSAKPTGNQTINPSSATADIQGKVSSRTKTKAKKKSDFTPELLPGQTTIGQIPGA